MVVGLHAWTSLRRDCQLCTLLSIYSAADEADEILAVATLPLETTNVDRSGHKRTVRKFTWTRHLCVTTRVRILADSFRR